MAKSKNRKDHAKKVQQRRIRLNEQSNMQKKQIRNWVQNMQQQIAAEKAAQNVIDVNAAQEQPIAVETPQVEQIVEQPTGSSGQLS